VSDDTPVTKTISSLTVSGSRAIVNWSTLPAVRLTPPIKADAVPVATTIVVALLEMEDANVVSVLIDEYRLVMYFP
jgi:hypothetical protein